MNNQFILQTICRDKGELRFLVESEGKSWRTPAREIPQGDLPIEAALTYAESIFGSESVCTLWKLGQVNLDTCLTHIFCLDTETIEYFSSTTAIPHMIWIDEQEFYQNIPKVFAPLLKKISQTALNK
jgi:hypothetical protein